MEIVFFDSFRQGLEQQKGIKVTTQQLRKDCKEFAQKNPPEWFREEINNDYDEIAGRLVRCNITPTQYADSIENNEFWGRPEIEDRILCEKYDVKLHVVEESSYFILLQQKVSNGTSGFSGEIQSAIIDSDSNKMLAKKLQEIASDEALRLLADMENFVGVGNMHQLISSSGSRPTNNPDYNDQHTIHITNGGRNHFEPLLDRNKGLTRQPQELKQEQKNHKFAEKAQQEQKDYKFAKKLQQEEDDHQMAKELQVDEILGYFNMPKTKDSPLRKEVQKTLDELLAKNSNKEIVSVIDQCTNNLKQHISKGKLQQEKESRESAEELQAREISSFMINAFQEHSNKLSAEQPQKQPQEEKKDYLLARKLQEREDYMLALTLQRAENHSAITRSSQNPGKSFAARLQREENLGNSFTRQNPRCSSFADLVDSKRKQTPNQPPLIRI